MSGPVTPDMALDALRRLHDEVTIGDGKPSHVRKLLRSPAVLTALAACPMDQVMDLIEQMRDVRGYASPCDELRNAIRSRSKAHGGEQYDPAVWAQLSMRCKADGTVVGPEPSLRNVALILEHDRRMKGKIRLNEMSHKISLRGLDVTDLDEVNAAIWIDDTYQLRAPTSMIHEAMMAVGAKNSFHPVREYLDGLEWDGGKRIDHWLPVYCASPNKTIVRAYSRRWMISAVARIMRPGCKVDTTLILQGLQGARKSTAFETLCSAAWFSDTAVDLRDKDALQALQGIWVYEFAELDSVRRSEATSVKAFLSSRADRFRPSYGRNMIRYDRQCVIVGTTNETNFLRDATGSRRFWPVQVGAIDIDGLEADRDQLWAEAVAAYNAGEQWWLTEDEEKRREASAYLFTEADAWEEPIAEWLGRIGHVQVSTLQVWTDGLGKRKGDLTAVSRKRLVRILEAQGFKRKHTRTGKVYERA